jgi:hypothetical protein
MADSINKQIQRLKENVSNAYKVMEETGYELSHVENTDNLEDNMSYMQEGAKVIEVGITQDVEVDPDEYIIIELAKVAGGSADDSKLFQKKTYTITESDLDGNKIVIRPDDEYAGLASVTVDLSELIRILSEI